mgnify:CR=1 FL=1
MLVSLLAAAVLRPSVVRHQLRARLVGGGARVRRFAPLVFDGGSGDKVFDWVLVFCLLLVVAAGTASLVGALTAAGRTTRGFIGGSRLFMRFSLGARLMISYGMVKAIPLQMPAPGPMRLVEQFGNFSPMGVLWAAIGASPSYEMSAGFAELAGGILICLPGLATIGALVCLADGMQVFTLNMCYDVPVKLFSFHLIVMSLVVLGPELTASPRTIILLNRAAGPSTVKPFSIWRTARTRKSLPSALRIEAIDAMHLATMNLLASAAKPSAAWRRRRNAPLKGHLDDREP